jgi:hypothetical protein
MTILLTQILDIVSFENLVLKFFMIKLIVGIELIVNEHDDYIMLFKN